MSKSGKNHTKEKITQRNLLEKKKNHPVRLFIKSWDFWGKSFLSFFIFIPIVYFLSDSGTKHILIIIYSCICIPLLPFAKKCSDDIFLHYFSKDIFDEYINGGGAKGGGALYLMVLIPLIIPLAIGYFVYQIKKYRK
ncbi:MULTISPECIES: hypothetical protein [Proteus]|uniref:Colicin transporter n=1 Tax=Proteus appendicitidis TaxID=3034648 RepID=A0ABY8YCB1_9GAMM|nr:MULTISPECIES: hypothetical protein [unclassified Proteus (in: enterobacteria)]WIV90085.1 hypothetical protein QQS39_08805 [Proteus sp. HZ0627]